MNVKKIKGFTLIELMVVVAIIAILAAIAIPAIFRYRIDANRAKCVGNMKQIQNAVEGYRSGHGGKTAAVNWASYTDSNGKNYFKKPLTCPQGNSTLQYDLSKVNSETWVPQCPVESNRGEPYNHKFEN